MLGHLEFKMASNDSSDFDELLRKADIFDKKHYFVEEGVGKLEHFIDADFDFLTATIGLKKIQAKRLVRILQELHGIKTEININTDTDTAAKKDGKKLLRQAVFFHEKSEHLSDPKRLKLSVPSKSASEADETSLTQEWEKFLYLHPKTLGMRFYNEIIPVIANACFGVMPSFDSYLREQLHFRWESKVALDNSDKKMKYFRGPGSGIQRFLPFKGAPRSMDVKTLEKLIGMVTEVENSTNERIKSFNHRRNLILIDSGPTGIRKHFEEEYSYLGSMINKFSEIKKDFSCLISQLNDTLIQFRRARITKSAANDLTSKQRRNKKEMKGRNVSVEKSSWKRGGQKF